LLTYRYVADVRSLWPVVKPGVESIRSGDSHAWLCEDVYAALMSGRAAMYVFNDEQGAHAGFGVYEVMPLPYEANPVLNIWLGHAEKPAYGHYGVELSRKIAGSMGIERIVFSTTQDAAESAWLKQFHLMKAYYEVT
jgi:hypothetical protein